MTRSASRRVVGLGEARGRQRVRHTMGIVDVHLAAEGFDVDFAGSGRAVQCAARIRTVGRQFNPSAPRFVPSIHTLDFVAVLRRIAQAAACAGRARPRSAPAVRLRTVASSVFAMALRSVAPSAVSGSPKVTTASTAPRRHQRLDVRDEVEIAVPGDQRAVLPPHRNAVEAGVADRHRLDEDAALGAGARFLAPRRSAPSGTAARGCRRSRCLRRTAPSWCRRRAARRSRRWRRRSAGAACGRRTPCAASWR